MRRKLHVSAVHRTRSSRYRGTPIIFLPFKADDSTFLPSSVHFNFLPSTPLPVWFVFASLPGRLDLWECQPCWLLSLPLHGLLLGGRFARRLQRATGPNTRAIGCRRATRLSLNHALDPEETCQISADALIRSKFHMFTMHAGPCSTCRTV